MCKYHNIGCRTVFIGIFKEIKYIHKANSVLGCLCITEDELSKKEN